jgi:hypothetical protein
MKAWEKPRLIVLVRGRPEAALLVYCKGVPLQGDPSTELQGCAIYDPTFFCLDCYSVWTS